MGKWAEGGEGGVGGVWGVGGNSLGLESYLFYMSASHH